jgi:RNA polymerase sigma-70 factor (sigma-E family)
MRDDDDFASFASARWSTLFRLAYLLTGSVPAADDVLQSSLEKVFVNWARVRRMGGPEAYVRKVMVNTVISGRRRIARRPEELRSTAPEQKVDSGEQGIVDHQMLWPLVRALPQRQRAVIVLRYYEDLTETAAADLLGCSVGTVKSQTHDAMRTLRRQLQASAAVVEGVTES